jgi:hypothetical protein
VALAFGPPAAFALVIACLLFWYLFLSKFFSVSQVPRSVFSALSAVVSRCYAGEVGVI